MDFYGYSLHQLFTNICIIIVIIGAHNTFLLKKKKKIVKVQATIKKVYNTTCIFKLQCTSQIQKKDT